MILVLDDKETTKRLNENFNYIKIVTMIKYIDKTIMYELI